MRSEVAASSRSADLGCWSLVGRIWIPLAMAAPVLAFPLASPVATVGCLSVAAAWLVVADRSGRDHSAGNPSPGSSLKWPLLALFALALVGSYLSAYWWLTLPKLAGLVLGLLTLRAILLTGTSSSRVRWLTLAYLVCGLATILTAVLAGPRWKWWGNQSLTELAWSIPAVVRLPSMDSEINPNALGGTTLFFLPVFIALALPWPRRRVPASGSAASEPGVGLKILERSLCLLSALLLFAVLLLCQSRTAGFSAVASILLVLSIRFRIMAWLCGLTAVAAGLAVWWIGPATAIQELAASLQYDKLVVRQAEGHYVIQSFASGDRALIWTFAIQAIRDHPWLGVGLGAFRGAVTRRVDRPRATEPDADPREDGSRRLHHHEAGWTS